MARHRMPMPVFVRFFILVILVLCVLNNHHASNTCFSLLPWIRGPHIFYIKGYNHYYCNYSQWFVQVMGPCIMWINSWLIFFNSIGLLCYGSGLNQYMNFVLYIIRLLLNLPNRLFIFPKDIAGRVVRKLVWTRYKKIRAIRPGSCYTVTQIRV